MSNLNFTGGKGPVAQKGPNSDYVSHGTKVTNTGELSICEVPNAGQRFQPTTCIDKQWQFEDFANKWIDVGTILVTPTATAGTILHSYSIPHDIKVSTAVKVPFDAFVFYRCNVLMQFTFPTLLTNQGQLRVFFVPGSRIVASAYGKATASLNQGFLMNMNSGKGGIITCTYNNYYNYLNTSDVGFTADEVATIGQVVVIVMQPYRGAASTPMSVKALITQADFRIPRNISLGMREVYAEDNHFYPFPPRANLTAEEWNVYRMVFAKLPEDSNKKLMVIDKSRPSIRDVGEERRPHNQLGFGEAVHPQDQGITMTELNAIIAAKAKIDCVTFVNDPFCSVDEGCSLVDNELLANQGLFDFVGEMVGGLFGGGGGGTTVHNDNTYDARTFYNVQGDVSGGIRQDTYKGGDALDQRDQQAYTKSDATSLGVDATIPPMDKPDICAPGRPVYKVPMMPQANVSGIPTIAEYMDFEAYGRHKFPLINLGILADEMSMRSIMERPTVMGYGYSFSFTTATVAGTHLLTIPITPCPVTFRGGTGATAVEVSSLEYMMTMFSAWKGTINYTFQFSKTGFGRARVFFASSYGELVSAPTPAITDNKSQYVADLDLSDAIETYTIKMPYMSNLDAMNVSAMVPVGSTAPVLANALARASPGNLHVYALTPANSTDGTPQTIDCEVYIWACPDMAWAHPAVNDIYQPSLAVGTTRNGIEDPNEARRNIRAMGVTNQIGGLPTRDVYQEMEEEQRTTVIDDDERQFPRPTETEEGRIATENAMHPERYQEAYERDTAPNRGVVNQGGDDFLGGLASLGESLSGSLAFGRGGGGRGRGGSRGTGKTTSANTGPQKTSFGNQSGGPVTNNGDVTNVFKQPPAQTSRTNNGPRGSIPVGSVENQIGELGNKLPIGNRPMPGQASTPYYGNMIYKLPIEESLDGGLPQIGSTNDGPPIAELGYSDMAGDMSISADMLLANGGIDQPVSPPTVVTLQPDPITAIYRPGPTVDTTTKFGVTPALKSLKNYTKRMTTVATVGLGTATISPTGLAADNQTVSFIALPIHTGGMGQYASMLGKIAAMYNYFAGTIIYQFHVVYDKTNRKNDGLVFKATTVPINSNGYIGGAPVGQAYVNAFGRPFLAMEPNHFAHHNQPTVHMTDDCHVMTVRVPFNNQGSYMRPYQLYNQDHATAAPTFLRPFIYKDLAGVTQYNLNQVKELDFERYCSGAIVFGIDNGSVMDLAAVPAVKVIVRMCLGDDCRFGRIFQIPRLVYSTGNRDLIPFFGPFAAPAREEEKVLKNQIGSESLEDLTAMRDNVVRLRNGVILKIETIKELDTVHTEVNRMTEYDDLQHYFSYTTRQILHSIEFEGENLILSSKKMSPCELRTCISLLKRFGMHELSYISIGASMNEAVLNSELKSFIQSVCDTILSQIPAVIEKADEPQQCL
jgi:hypothetical protein